MTVSLPMPSYALDAEQAVLGAILLEPGLIVDALAHLHSDDFHKEAHRTIFAAMARIHGRGTLPDTVTMADELRTTRALEAVGGHAALAILQEAGTVATQFAAYVEQIRASAARRRLVRLGRELATQAAEDSRPPSEIVAATMGALLEIDHAQPEGDILTPPQVAAAMVQAPADPGLRTGLRLLDDACDGLRRGNLVVIAGRPGMGKTALGIQIAHHLSVAGPHPVLFATLEMRTEEIVLRLQGLMLGRSTRELRAGYYAHGECARVLDTIARSQFHLWDATAPTVADVAANIRRAVLRYKAEAVVVDHLGKMRGTRRDNRYLEVGELAQTLKATAKQLGIPIVALHQLNRDVERRTSPRPVLADLRDSGNVEEEADAVVFLWTGEERPEGKDPLPVHLYLAKNRHGETADQEYRFEKRRGRFTEAP
jgi:replicative DNA helicase